MPDPEIPRHDQSSAASVQSVKSVKSPRTPPENSRQYDFMVNPT